MREGERGAGTQLGRDSLRRRTSQAGRVSGGDAARRDDSAQARESRGVKVVKVVKVVRVGTRPLRRLRESSAAVGIAHLDNPGRGQRQRRAAGTAHLRPMSESMEVDEGGGCQWRLTTTRKCDSVGGAGAWPGGGRYWRMGDGEPGHSRAVLIYPAARGGCPRWWWSGTITSQLLRVVVEVDAVVTEAGAGGGPRRRWRW